jgi:hypothetical protein
MEADLWRRLVAWRRASGGGRLVDEVEQRRRQPHDRRCVGKRARRCRAAFSFDGLRAVTAGVLLQPASGSTPLRQAAHGWRQPCDRQRAGERAGRRRVASSFDGLRAVTASVLLQSTSGGTPLLHVARGWRAGRGGLAGSVPCCCEMWSGRALVRAPG